MRGVAHEVAAIYDKAVNFKEFTLSETDQAAADALSVGIETDKRLTMQLVSWIM